MFTLVSAFLSKTSEDSSFLVKGRSCPRWSGRWCWDTRHLGVSLLMERYSLTRGRLLPRKRAGGTGEGAFHGVLYRFHGNPPNVLSNYHLVLPHAPPSPPSRRSNCRPPSLSFTLVPTKQPKKDSKEGTKRLVTSCSVSNNLWDLCAHAGHLHALRLLEGRHGTFNSLFKGMKHSAEKRDSRWQFSSVVHFSLQLFHRLISLWEADVPIQNYRYTIVEHQQFHFNPLPSIPYPILETKFLSADQT